MVIDYEPRGRRNRRSERLGVDGRAREGRRPAHLRSHRRRTLQPDLPGRDAVGTAFALRRPPTSHVLPTAHDMVREYTVISALHPLGVPVAEPLGLCIDEEVNERPFYVMEFVEGAILRDAPRPRRPSTRPYAASSAINSPPPWPSSTTSTQNARARGPRAP